MSYTQQALELLELAYGAGEEALAEAPVALDVSDHLYLADIFFIVTADNPRHAKSVADEIQDAIKAETGKLPLAVEGELGGGWTVLDYGDLIVHIQQAEEREYYALEKLWAKAPRIELATQTR